MPDDLPTAVARAIADAHNALADTMATGGKSVMRRAKLDPEDTRVRAMAHAAIRAIAKDMGNG